MAVDGGFGNNIAEVDLFIPWYLMYHRQKSNKASVHLAAFELYTNKLLELREFFTFTNLSSASYLFLLSSAQHNTPSSESRPLCTRIYSPHVVLFITQIIVEEEKVVQEIKEVVFRSHRGTFICGNKNDIPSCCSCNCNWSVTDGGGVFITKSPLLVILEDDSFYLEMFSHFCCS